MAEILGILKFENRIKTDEALNFSSLLFWQRGEASKFFTLLATHYISLLPSPNFKRIVYTDHSILQDYALYIRTMDSTAIAMLTTLNYPAHLIVKAADEEGDVTKVLVKYNEIVKEDKLVNIQEKLKETKQIMVDNITQVLKRKDKIETLEIESLELLKLSKGFIKNTKDLNRCCIIL